MKLKKIFINIVAVLMACLSVCFFTACEDIVTVEVKFGAYDYETETNEEFTLSVNLYRHLAPETVDSIVKNINDGAYNNLLVYKFVSANTSQYMLGDLKYAEDGSIVQNVLPEIKGEFESNGVKGSNLKVEKGSIGIWRSYYACDTGMTVTSDARDTGRGTWFMPIEANSAYDGNVCVFGKVDLTAESTIEVFETLENAFKESDRYLNYEVYYTGSYDETKANENYGLTFNITPADTFSEKNVKNLFVADGEKQELKWYNHYTISVPQLMQDNTHSLKVTSVTVK